MKIAIFGGRFDPPHTGHQLVAQQILEIRKDVDKLLFVPAYKHQWKPIVAGPEDRVEMLKFILGPRMEISDLEIKRGGISYSVDTVNEIKRQTGAEIFWVCGADILHEFNRWGHAEELQKLAKFLVVPRDPHQIPQNIPEGFEIVTSPNLVTTNYSSTEIRDRLKNGKSITGLVPEGVEEYIKKNKLYV